MLAKLTWLNTSYRGGDNEQISQGGGLGCAGGGTARAAGLRAQEQSQEVHAASVVRLPGAEELLAHRLSRRGGGIARQSLAGPIARVARDSTLHDAAKSFASVAHAPARAAVIESVDPLALWPVPARQIRGRRLDGTGIHKRQRVLRPTACAQDKSLENRGLPSLPQARPGLRYSHALHRGGACRPRSQAGRGRISNPGRGNPAVCPPAADLRRRGVRFRGEPSLRARRT